MDATCAPSRIKYPRDMELLNEGREKLEHIITVLHTPTDGKKPRTYCRKARKDYLNIVRAKKNKAKKLWHGIRKQLQYLARDQRYIADLLQDGRQLAHKYQQQLTVIQQMYAQQKYMYDHHIHRMEHRIVNLRQPFLRPIVRGKVKAPVEFGAKLGISVVNGMVRLERQSFETYNKSTLLPQEIERYQDRYGHYPERVLADKIYRNRVNLAYCKERGIRLSGPALGRPKKDAVRDRRLEYKDNCDRVEVERAFSLAKRRFGLTAIRTYLKETTQSVIALSILALNLGKLQAIQYTPMLFYLQLLLWKVKRALKWLPCQKVTFAQ
ncbi:MAG: transposase [Megasphaera cerevisiae]|nr:transposase [Megasphaera cerevisiae]